MSSEDHAARLEQGIREVLEDLKGAPCSFFACPGPDHPPVPMATCNVCSPQIDLRALIGDPVPPCTRNPCGVCGRDIRCGKPVDWDNGHSVISQEPCYLHAGHAGECDA